MCDWLCEKLASWGLVKVPIIEEKRFFNGETVELDVRNFFVNPDNAELQMIVEQFELSTVEDVKHWVFSHIDYTPEEKDFWQLPFETLARREGDCDDQAILTAALLLAIGKRYFDVMIQVVETPRGWHCFTTYKGKVVDPLFLDLTVIPEDWKFWYCWNPKSCYTSKENYNIWRGA